MKLKRESVLGVGRSTEDPEWPKSWRLGCEGGEPWAGHPQSDFRDFSKTCFLELFSPSLCFCILDAGLMQAQGSTQKPKGTSRATFCEFNN